MRRIHAEEGGAALFRGIVPRMVWISVGGAVFIGSFEELRRQLGRRLGDADGDGDSVVDGDYA